MEDNAELSPVLLVDQVVGGSERVVLTTGPVRTAATHADKGGPNSNAENNGKGRNEGSGGGGSEDAPDRNSGGEEPSDNKDNQSPSDNGSNNDDDDNDDDPLSGTQYSPKTGRPLRPKKWAEEHVGEGFYIWVLSNPHEQRGEITDPFLLDGLLYTGTPGNEPVPYRKKDVRTPSDSGHSSDSVSVGEEFVDPFQYPFGADLDLHGHMLDGVYTPDLATRVESDSSSVAPSAVVPTVLVDHSLPTTGEGLVMPPVVEQFVRDASWPVDPLLINELYQKAQMMKDLSSVSSRSNYRTTGDLFIKNQQEQAEDRLLSSSLRCEESESLAEEPEDPAEREVEMELEGLEEDDSEFEPEKTLDAQEFPFLTGTAPARWDWFRVCRRTVVGGRRTVVGQS